MTGWFNTKNIDRYECGNYGGWDRKYGDGWFHVFFRVSDGMHKIASDSFQHLNAIRIITLIITQSYATFISSLGKTRKQTRTCLCPQVTNVLAIVRHEKQTCCSCRSQTHHDDEWLWLQRRRNGHTPLTTRSKIEFIVEYTPPRG